MREQTMFGPNMLQAANHSRMMKFDRYFELPPVVAEVVEDYNKSEPIFMAKGWSMNRSISIFDGEDFLRSFTYSECEALKSKGIKTVMGDFHARTKED